MSIGKQNGEPPVPRRELRLASRGQGTVEYVLIVSLVVVAVFGLMFLFRHQIFSFATEAWLKILEWTGNSDS